MGNWYEKLTIGLVPRARLVPLGPARGARLPGKRFDLRRAPRRRRRRREGADLARFRARGQGRALDGQPPRVAPRDARDHGDRRRAHVDAVTYPRRIVSEFTEVFPAEIARVEQPPRSSINVIPASARCPASGRELDARAGGAMCSRA